MRDGLSLLDQAIALSGNSEINEAAVRDMLGIADRNLVFDLFETVLKGDAAGALDRMDSLYQGGADPLLVLQDLLELSHFVTRLKLAPEAGTGDPLEEGERERARPIAAALSMPVLARAWQMLLKGLEEVQAAPTPAQAAQMVLVRLAYVADLPVPADLVRALSAGEGTATPSPPPGERVGVRGQSAEATRPPSPSHAGACPRAALRADPGGAGPSLSRTAGEGLAPVSSAAAPAIATPPSVSEVQLDPMPQSFGETVALFASRREAVIAAHLKANVRLVSFEPGRIEIRPTEAAPGNLTNQLGQLLSEWTGTRWIVAVSQSEGAPSLAEEEARHASVLRHEVAAHPLVRAVLDAFPGATIAAVRERFVAGDAGTEAAPDDVGDTQGEDGVNAGEDGS